MPGIVISTKKRILLDKKIKEVEIPTNTLNIGQFFQDLTAMDGLKSQFIIESELGLLPNTVKNDAATVLVCGAYKEGTVYGYNCDTKSIEEFAFTRNSAATRFNALGKMEIVSPGIPRTEYNPITKILKGYLIEPASSNLFTDSGMSLTSGNITLDWDMGSIFEKGIRHVWQDGQVVSNSKTVNVTAGTSYVFSVFVKMDNGTAPVASGSLSARDVALVALGSNREANVEHIGNGVYRVWLTIVATNTTIGSFGVSKYYQSSNKPYTFSGMQLEEGIVPTSYIPTVSSSVTRLADRIISLRPLSIFEINSLFLSCDQVIGWFGKLPINGTNLLLNSNSLSLFSGYFGAELVKTPNIEVTEWSAKNANRVISIGGTSMLRVLLSLGTPMDGEVVSASGWFKNNGTKNIAINSNQGGRQVILAPNEQRYIKFENIVGNGNGNVQFQINPLTLEDNVDFTWWRLKYEKGPVCTPYSVNPSDYVKIFGDNKVEISAIEPVSVRSFAIVPRKLNSGEF